ncbi:hypothetical protein N7478_009271 [Penicillium angulare]|uniref:uncharacterized protein n=1 Tax=Penicillium angulare TaxID=116970 RepID=UPI002542359E|nr:uncharacterized protein N7478_009271 [Penicillium angulare]KAJ5266463.1 hypothetical protein N7478_009271 [Penicillium angulare]
MTETPNRGIVVISGGSAANNLVDVFNTIRESKDCRLSYIIPISDNGGSSSELIRIFGGPGIGDVRIRLIPDSPMNSERTAIKSLFNHRLPSEGTAASQEWLSIVDGTSGLWQSIAPAKKELIRSFFNSLNLEILKRARPPSSTFDFTSASVGNLFLTGARLFSGSFESAIYLLGSICGVQSDIVRVIPAINSNFSHHISATLADGTVIVGQNSISHPSAATALGHDPRARRPSLLLADGDDFDDTDLSDLSDTVYEEDYLPGSLATLRNKNIAFSKAENEDLPCRIDRIWYINPYGQEIRPPANPRVLEALDDAQAIVYSIGSLYTSIIPAIILRGVGKSIVTSPARHKILILNGSMDRETGPPCQGLVASEFVEAIVRAGEESCGRHPASFRHHHDFRASASSREKRGPHTRIPYTSYVTHVLHLDGPGTPHVDRDRLAEMGIETLRLYGRKILLKTGDGDLVVGAKYDSTALTQALEVVLGKKGDAMVSGLGRRNTLDPTRREKK